jgi:hypothetical protein
MVRIQFAVLAVYSVEAGVGICGEPFSAREPR